MDIQRLRNLTTQRLHTKMEHIYEDLENITGEKGLFTHMLPNICKACLPWLREHVTEPRFWEDKYDTTHIGEFELPPHQLLKIAKLYLLVTYQCLVHLQTKSNKYSCITKYIIYCGTLLA